MKNIIIILFYFVFGTSLSSQECYIVDNYDYLSGGPCIPNTYPRLTVFEFSDTIVVLGDDHYSVIETSVEDVENKQFLQNKFNCSFTFYRLSSNSTGIVTSYELNTDNASIGNRIHLVEVTSCGKKYKYLLTMEGTYRLANRAYILSSLNGLKLVDKSKSYSYVEHLDTIGFLSVIEDPKYDTLTEEVLYYQSYKTLEIIDAKWDTTYHIISSEYSNCPDFQYEYIDTTLTLQDNYANLTVEDVQFEEVYEEIVVVLDYYSDINYYNREPMDSNIVISDNSYELKVDTVNPELMGGRYIQDIQYHIDTTVIAIDSFYFQNAYPTCEVGYTPAGTYCVRENQGNNTYEIRYYYKLVKDASTIVSDINSRDTVFQVQRIINKSSLADTCISIKMDTIPYIRLIEPATTILHTVPAQYEQRNFYKVKTPAVIDYKLGIEEPIEYKTINYSTYQLKSYSQKTVHLTDCVRKEIIDRLSDLDYTILDYNMNADTFYRAIIEYQKDHFLNIGFIDKLFLKSLLD